jgi:hypothetical protein
MLVHHTWLLLLAIPHLVNAAIIPPIPTHPLSVPGLNCHILHYLTWPDFHRITTTNRDLLPCRHNTKAIAHALINTDRQRADLLAIRMNMTLVGVWRELLALGLTPSAHRQASIRWASANGHVDLVRFLLLQDPRVDPSTHSNHPVQMSAKNGHLPVVEVLLSDHRVNPATQPAFTHPFGRRTWTLGHRSAITSI